MACFGMKLAHLPVSPCSELSMRSEDNTVTLLSANSYIIQNYSVITCACLPARIGR